MVRFVGGWGVVVLGGIFMDGRVGGAGGILCVRIWTLVLRLRGGESRNGWCHS